MTRYYKKTIIDYIIDNIKKMLVEAVGFEPTTPTPPV